MKKRMTVSILTICLAALLLFAGCSSKKEPDVAPDNSQTTETPVTPSETPEETPAEPETGSNELVATLSGLMGKTDADVIAALGEGTKTQGEDGTLQVREYTQNVMGVDSQIAVSYDQDEVFAISIYAGENKFDDWSAQLKTDLGEPATDTTSDADGNDASELTWTLDGGVIASLKNAYDTLSLEFFIGA